MNVTACIGIDAGESLAAGGCWPWAEGEMETLAAHWPLRSEVRAFRAARGADAARLVREICTTAGREPGGCLLVPLGQTELSRACTLAGELRVSHLLVPARPVALSVRGLVPAARVIDYGQLAPDGESLSLPLLREWFVEMMEAAADAVAGLGYDQDDAQLDRYVEVRCHGRAGSFIIPAEAMSGVEALLQPLRELSGEMPPAERISIAAAHLRCIITPPMALKQPTPSPASPAPAMPPGWGCHRTTAGHLLCRPSV